MRFKADEERFAEHARRPALEHVRDYLAHSEHVGQAPRHVVVKRAHLTGLLTATNAQRLADLEPNAVERHLRGLREAGKSARTVNGCRAAAVAFMNWAVRVGRVASNPLGIVGKLDERRDRRRVRRALNGDELAALLAVAGPRRPLYLTAALTGLRRGELRKLTWADIDLGGACLRVRVGVGKAAREDFIPLHPQVVEALRAWRPATQKATDAVFPALPPIAQVYADFDAAGIERADAEGRVVDLHSLRTTLATGLARAGVAPQVAMRVMRHADIKTTLAHYTDLRIADAARAVAALPPIEPAAAATGTYGRADGDDSRAAPAQRARHTMGHSGARASTLQGGDSTSGEAAQASSDARHSNVGRVDSETAGERTRTVNVQLGRLMLYH